MKRILYFCGLGLMVLLGGYTAVAWGMTRGLGAYRLNTQVGAVLAGSWQITGLLALAVLLALLLPTVRLVRGLVQGRGRRAGMPRSVPFAPAGGYAPQGAAPAQGAPAGQPGQSGVPPQTGNAPTAPAGVPGEVTAAAPGVPVSAAGKPAVHRMQFCTRCGKKAEPGQRFCTGCGAPLEEE